MINSTPVLPEIEFWKSEKVCKRLIESMFETTVDICSYEKIHEHGFGVTLCVEGMKYALTYSPPQDAVEGLYEAVGVWRKRKDEEGFICGIIPVPISLFDESRENYLKGPIHCRAVIDIYGRTSGGGMIDCYVGSSFSSLKPQSLTSPL